MSPNQTSSSLPASMCGGLDSRQREMLEAMGVTGWWPASTQAQALASETEAVIEQRKAIEHAAEPAVPLSPVQQPAGQAHEIATEPARRVELAADLDWVGLQHAVAHCQACGLCQSRQKTVFGVGPTAADAMTPPQARWLIVGEAPGEHEDRQGQPFVGQAGQLLDNMLAALKLGRAASGRLQGLSRHHEVYITNVIKCRPPANRNPSAGEVASCEPYLARQIELLRPAIIVAMGKYAITSLTGRSEPVGKLRGTVHPLRHPSHQAPVVVTYHPAYLLRNLPEKAKAWADLVLALQTYQALQATFD